MGKNATQNGNSEIAINCQSDLVALTRVPLSISVPDLDFAGRLEQQQQNLFCAFSQCVLHSLVFMCAFSLFILEIERCISE